MSTETEQKRTKGTGVRLAYETLRDEILSLALAPGTLLDETTLAERFAMSRSPVREALIRLAGDDLVITLANRSTVVAPIDIQSFPRYIEALDIAQRMTTRLAAERRDDQDLKTIARRQKDFVATVRAGNHLAMSESNRMFHMAIAEAGQNPYLTAFYGRLLNQGRRMLHLHFGAIEKGLGGYFLTEEHDEMLEAIRARDVARADALAQAHTRQFQENFLHYLRHNALAGVPLGEGYGSTKGD